MALYVHKGFIVILHAGSEGTFPRYLIQTSHPGPGGFGEVTFGGSVTVEMTE